MQTEPEVLTDHTELICSTNIERIVMGRNAALAQTEALIFQLEGISATTNSIGGGIARDWAMRQDFRCGCWLLAYGESRNGYGSDHLQSRSRYMARFDEENGNAQFDGRSGKRPVEQKP